MAPPHNAHDGWGIILVLLGVALAALAFAAWLIITEVRSKPKHNPPVESSINFPASFTIWPPEPPTPKSTQTALHEGAAPPRKAKKAPSKKKAPKKLASSRKKK